LTIDKVSCKYSAPYWLSFETHRVYTSYKPTKRSGFLMARPLHLDLL